MSMGALPSSTDLTSTTILMKLACDRILPDARTPLARPYKQWRRVHAVAVRSAERSAQHIANLRLLDSLVRGGITPRDRGDARAYCIEELPQVLIAAGASPDRRLRTPESTWEAFVSALDAGDRKTAIRCLRDPALERHRVVLDTISADGMRSMARSLGAMEMSAPVGSMPTARVRRANGTALAVFFFQEPNGDWKIAAM